MELVAMFFCQELEMLVPLGVKDGMLGMLESLSPVRAVDAGEIMGVLRWCHGENNKPVFLFFILEKLDRWFFMDASSSLAKLKEGNARFVAGKMAGKNPVARRSELVAGQHPFASILSCSDSRVVPEYIFDTDMGEIFIIRTAGNVADKVGLGSIEYGCEHLHTPLLVVMGHEACGAVKATCDCKGECHEGNIKAIVDEVKKAASKKGWAVPDAIMENVACSIANVREKSAIIRHLEHEGKLKIVGAYYSLSSGEVRFLA